MIYKVMFWFGLALAAILVISNMVYDMGNISYILWMNVSIWKTIIAALLVGFMIGIGFNNMFDAQKKATDEDDLYFN